MSEVCQFLASLPVIPVASLPKDCEFCSICHEDYATDITSKSTNECQISPEQPVILPCKHIFGQACISHWLSADSDEPRNTCPLCRTVLFDINEEPLESGTWGYGFFDDLELLPTPLIIAEGMIMQLEYNHSDDLSALRTQLVNAVRETRSFSAPVSTSGINSQRIDHDDPIRLLATYSDLAPILDRAMASEFVAALHDVAAQKLQLMDMEAEAEHKKYLNNMTILYAILYKRLNTNIQDLEAMESWDAVFNLKELVRDVPLAPWHDRYLNQIAEYWRKTAGTSEARIYEDVWAFVAGRALRQE